MKSVGRFGQVPLNWLQRILGTSPRQSAVPVGEAVYAVGDIHGRADLLDDLLQRIAHDAARHADDHVRRLVFLGDYVDRGSASRAVVERLLRPPLPSFATIYLRGNHEQAMLDFLDERSDGQAWLTYGGAETLMSYGVSVMGCSTNELRGALAAALPPPHLNFLRACILHHTVGDYVFVHAGVRPRIALNAQDPLDLLWIRDDFLDAAEALPGKVLVHGHTIRKRQENLAHRINIDTGAFFSGRLTCVVLRSNTRRFLATCA
jgi:serine/threonine protein phosphatase 1